MSMPDYVYAELANEALDTAIKVIELLLNKEQPSTRLLHELLYDLKAIGKELSCR